MSRLRASSISVRLIIPTNIGKALREALDSAAVGHAIRESIRAAIRPMHNHLKALIKSDMLSSDASTGALGRAVLSKHGRSKTNPNWFYGIVGIDAAVMEHHFLNQKKTPEGGRIAKSKGKSRGEGLYAVRLKSRIKRKSVSVRTKQVFSAYKDKKYRSYVKSGMLKRRPVKYFHLVDRGFNHRFAGMTRAYNFLSRARAATASTTQEIFVNKLKSLFLPTVVKMINRKIQRASR